MCDRNTIEPITDEHKSFKIRATTLLNSKNYCEYKADDITKIYCDNERVTIEPKDFTFILQIIITMFEMVAKTTLGLKSKDCIKEINIYILDNTTIWIEVFVKDDKVTKARFFGKRYSHIEAIRTLLTAFSGRTGLYVAIGCNS